MVKGLLIATLITWLTLVCFQRSFVADRQAKPDFMAVSARLSGEARAMKTELIRAYEAGDKSRARQIALPLADTLRQLNLHDQAIRVLLPFAGQTDASDGERQAMATIYLELGDWQAARRFYTRPGVRQSSRELNNLGVVAMIEGLCAGEASKRKLHFSDAGTLFTQSLDAARAGQRGVDDKGSAARANLQALKSTP